MPFDACITAAVDAKEITEKQAELARGIYRDHLDAFESSMPRAEAMAEAARSTMRFMEEHAAEKRRQAFLTLAARDDIMSRLNGYTNYRTGKADPYKGATGLFDRLLPGRNGFAVEQQRYYWRNAAWSMMDEAFKQFRPDWLLRRRGAPLMETVVRELFGETTGDPLAKTLAKSWTDAAEFLRSNFNRFGGHIGLLENWGLPQAHDRKAIRAAGLEEWRNFVTPLLDTNKMVDRDTGEAFGATIPSLRDSSLKIALDGVYDNIITEGWSNREASAAGGRARANTRADSRFLVFKDADSWLAYQKRFGEPDPFNGMMRHIDGLARDISLMQVLGPNPASTMRWLGQELERRRAIAGERPDRVTGAMHLIGTMYDMTTGSAFAPVNSTVATIGSDVGNMLTAAQLGGAVLTAVPSDIAFQVLTRKLNGMPTMQVFKTLIRQLFDSGDKQAAIRIEAGASHFARALFDQQRYIGEMQGHATTKFIADRVLAMSGLSAWTEAGRASFFADALGTIADRAGLEWGKLPEDFRGALGRYRIDEAEWNAIRSTAAYADNGVNYIRPQDIANNKALDPSIAFDLAQRVADYAGSETEFAVPSHSLAGSAHARGRTPPGSVHSIATDSALKYKTFGFTLLMTHGRRLLAQGTLQKRGAYFGALVMTSMFAGAIALQTKEMIAGRNPRDMEDWRFWPAALIQGGGLGIIGDFIYSGVQGAARTGASLPETVAGPIAALLGDSVRALIGAPMSPQQKDVAAKEGSNLIEWTKRYIPGGSIWYARLVLERYLWDAAQEDIDPKWKTRVRAIEQWYRRNYHNSFWWRRGDQPGLDRSSVDAPDLSTALGGAQQ